MLTGRCIQFINHSKQRFLYTERNSCIYMFYYAINFAFVGISTLPTTGGKVKNAQKHRQPTEVGILFFFASGRTSGNLVHSGSKIATAKKKNFPHTSAESKFFLPLVFRKMSLSAKGMRKNSILSSGQA